MTRKKAAEIEDLLREIRSCENQLQQADRIFNPTNHTSSPINHNFFRIRVENMGSMLGDYDITESELKEVLYKIVDRVNDKLEPLKERLQKL